MKGVLITMLTLCPECELQVSDKAITCPHCGYPLKTDKITSRQSNKKRMRLPNGFGQITEIKGRNLRNRYRVMLTKGKDEWGKPVQKLLQPRAYFPSYKEAYEALLEYHRNPYDPRKDPTMEEVYNEWVKKRTEDLPEDKPTDSHNDPVKQYRSAWPYCSSIKDMKIRDIRAHHLKDCINYSAKTSEDGEIEASPQKKNTIKILLNLLFDYALEYEYVDKNYARIFKLPKNIKKDIDESLEHHMSFTDEEVNTLWENINDPTIGRIARLILVQCYMGWRPQELCKLRVENVHLDEKYIIGGMKTDNGRDRKVPIHPRIENIISDALTEARLAGSEYLFLLPNKRHNNRHTPLNYDRYYGYFSKIITALNFSQDHKPHDGRKRFVTAAKKAGLNEYVIKRIIGHSIADITEAIYTERDIEWLYEEICKIP